LYKLSQHIKQQSVKNLMNASLEELSLCPGIGEKKVKRLFETFNTPFVPSNNAQSKNATKAKKQVKLDLFLKNSPNQQQK